MKIAVIGSRTFDNYCLLEKELNDFDINKIISGGAKGADSLAEIYAKDKKIETLIFKPDWKRYGRGAGFIRNKLIIENCDFVIAFWDKKSKGTKNSLETAEKLNKGIKIIEI